MKKLTTAERLIVAADFKPTSETHWNYNVASQVIALSRKLKGTGVYIKVNSSLRAYGYDLIDEIHDCGLRVFADLKLIDIKETLSIDGLLIQETKPELLTTICTTGISAMRALKAELPHTELLGVTVLTNLKDEDTQAMFTCSIEEAVLKFANVGYNGAVDGLISSAKQVEMLRSEFGLLLSLNTPAIRPAWAIVPGDDQNPDQIMTPFKAIKAGADRIVIGRPITLSSDPYEAVMRTIDEINSATQ